MQGGNQEPKILVKELGFMDNGTGKHQSNTVYRENGLSPNITTIEGGGTQQIKICVSKQIPCKLDKMPDGHLDSIGNAKICDVDTPTASTVTSRYYKGIGAHKDNMCIVAMRGRNPDNPSDRSVGSPTEQRLEANTQGTSNCLTSVQKDNLVMESQVLTPKRTEYGKQIRKAYENGQIQESRHNMTELEPRHDGVSNTLTTVQKDNLLLEKPLLLGGVGKENEFGKQYRQGNRVYSSDACAMALGSQPVGNAGGNSYLYNVGYRIRKLTPRECGRLMGVSDEDISKMEEVNSNSQLYKQFGNSIVVDVMCAMFQNLNIKQED